MDLKYEYNFLKMEIFLRLWPNPRGFVYGFVYECEYFGKDTTLCVLGLIRDDFEISKNKNCI